MTRAEHLAWCKERALEYVDAGDLSMAVCSMFSDLGKHEETYLPLGSVLHMLGISYVLRGDREDMRRFIKGFQ